MDDQEFLANLYYVLLSPVLYCFIILSHLISFLPLTKCLFHMHMFLSNILIVFLYIKHSQPLALWRTISGETTSRHLFQEVEDAARFTNVIMISENNYSKTLHRKRLTRFCICLGFESTGVLKIPGFWVCQGFEYASGFDYVRILDVSQF